MPIVDSHDFIIQKLHEMHAYEELPLRVDNTEFLMIKRRDYMRQFGNEYKIHLKIGSFIRGHLSIMLLRFVLRLLKM